MLTTADTLVCATCTTAVAPSVYLSPVGNKRYELSNHLGNVMTVISDKITPIDTTSDGLWDYFNPSLVSATDYYPFGMGMPGRNYNAGSYEFGYNGKRMDNEMLGVGNTYDFGERLNNVQLGRWFTTDRFEAKYPAWSPYSSMMNNPLAYIDAKGDSVELIIGKPYRDANGEEHPYGHVALRVFNAAEGYDKAYDFGRYGKTWGLMGSKGDGILNTYADADAYLKSEMNQRSSVGYMQPTTADQDKQVMAYFDAMIKEGSVYKSGAVPGGGGTAYKLKSDYDVFDNNCTTMSCGGLGVLGMNWLGDEYDPRDALKTMEGSFKDLRLTRTEYLEGGEISLTYTPPALKPIKLGDFKLPSLNTTVPQDNTRVAKPVVIPQGSGQ